MENNEIEETFDTGVIYKITNNINNKIYIGRAYSYVGDGYGKLIRFGAKERFNKHISKALSVNEDIRNECPELYEDIRKYGKESFIVETIKITTKKHLKEFEERYIKKFESYKTDIGYNIMVGDKKPEDEERKEKYVKKKIETNKNRCIGGAMKRTEETKELPPNIYLMKKDGIINGYRVKIKINDKIFEKRITNPKLTLEEKLEKSIQALDKIKKENGEL